MSLRTLRIAAIFASIAALPVAVEAQWESSADSKYHQATHLGSPTSFYVPGVPNERSIRRMMRPAAMHEDIRQVMRDAGFEVIAADVISILQTGQVDESTARTSCAAVAPVDGRLRACSFPVFGKLDWMAYRRDMSVKIKPSARRSTPVLLDDVQWAGWKPSRKDQTFPAYIFRVVKPDAEYIFILPKPCANLSLLKRVPVEKPDLTLTKNVDKATADPGNDLTYTIRYANIGKGSANDLVLRDTLPPSTTFKSASNGGTASGSEVTWSLGSLAGGASGTVTLNVTIATNLPVGRTELLNKVVLRSRELPELSAQAPTTVVVPEPPVLTLDKTVDRDRAKPGEVLNYTIKYGNTGGSPAKDVVLRDTLPSEVTDPSPSPDVAVSGRDLTWRIGTLEPGASRTATIQARLKPTFPVGDTPVVNTSTLSATGLRTLEDDAKTIVSYEPPIEPRRFRFLADALVGKDRRVRPADLEEGRPFAFGQCSPLVGLKLGVSRVSPSGWEVAATGGVALSLVGSDKVREHALFVDGEINRYVGKGFVGTGISFWDLTRSETFTPAWLLHAGLPLHQSDRVDTHFMVEGRLFLRGVDDVSSNYQFWGGLRFTFKPAKPSGTSR